MFDLEHTSMPEDLSTLDRQKLHRIIDSVEEELSEKTGFRLAANNEDIIFPSRKVDQEELEQVVSRFVVISNMRAMIESGSKLEIAAALICFCEMFSKNREVN